MCEFYIAGQSFPQGSSGGFLGKFIFSNLVLIFGLIGSLLFLLIFLIPSVTLSLNISWTLLFTYVGKLILKISSLTRILLENVFKFLEKLISWSFAALKSLLGNIKDIQKNKQIDSLKAKSIKATTKKSPKIKAVPKTQSVINLKSDKYEEINSELISIKIKKGTHLKLSNSVDGNQVGPSLEYVKRWAPEKWKLSLFGNLHIISQNDFNLLESCIKKIK